MANEFMTYKEVAALLRVSNRTIRRWVVAEILRPVKHGGTIRFRRSEIVRERERQEFEEPRDCHDPSMW